MRQNDAQTATARYTAHNTDGATDRPRAVVLLIVGIIAYFWGWGVGLVEAAL